MIRAQRAHGCDDHALRVGTLALLALVACKDDAPRARPAEAATAPAAAAAPALAIELAAAKLPGALWFVDGTAGHRLVRLERGATKHIGKGADVFGALYPTSQRLPDGRVVAIASHGDGRAEGERLVLITSTGSIATVGPAAEQVRDPAVSPDGTWIVAAIQREGITNLDVISVSSGATKPLTTQREGNFAPVAISKDAIAFVSSRDGDSEIYRVDIDGTKSQRLTAFHREDYEPAIDVSGQQLAFTSDREQKVPRIFIVKPDGTGVRRLTQRPATTADEESSLVWSPSSPNAYAYTLRSGGHEQIVVGFGSASRTITPPDTDDSEPTFSPDGAWLAVVRQRGGGEHGGHGHSHTAAPSELVAYPLPIGSGDPIVVARGAIRTPRWF